MWHNVLIFLAGVVSALLGLAIFVVIAVLHDAAKHPIHPEGNFRQMPTYGPGRPGE